MTDTTHPHTRATCTDCDKPLGATRPTCYDCGGAPDRGVPVTATDWQMLLGVPYPELSHEQADARTYAPERWE